MLAPHLSYRTWRRSFDLKTIKPPSTVGRKADFPLFCCLRNELFRLPQFLDYYRGLGVQQFYFIDNDSTDGLQDYLAEQEDCAVWHTKASYKASNFGMDWCNYLLRRFGAGKWTLCVDPDEFLIYPNCETRSIGELTRYMDEAGQRSLFTTMIDCYSDRPIEETALDRDTNPFDLCPYFDRFNFTQTFNENGDHCWVQGGVRMRKSFFNMPFKAPALNKVPLIKWQKKYFYTSSMHQTNAKNINCNLSQSEMFVSGCLFHFKYVSELKKKSEEELARKQHYDNSSEYSKYASTTSEVYYDKDISVRYNGSKHLESMQFMQSGEWF